MHMCGGCSKRFGGLLLLIGILFLLADLGIWAFWGLSWWTVVFLLIGLKHFGTNSCANCSKAMKKR